MVPFLIQGLKKFLSTAKKIFIVIAVFTAIISLFSYFIFKDKAALQVRTNPVKNNRDEIYKVINDKKLNSTNEGKITVAVYRGTMCIMIGEACSNNPDDGNKNFEKSAFGMISKLFIIPFSTPPASGSYWVYTSLQSAGFIPKIYAAEGIGFATIKPFANLWKIFRDISYMVLVLILIAIGFMIMFRMKMNPQTVISVENALPRIIISLILITFSFAIAGFLIDLMYISIILITSLLSNNNQYFNSSQFQNQYISADILSLFNDVAAKNAFIGSGIFTKLADSLVGILPPFFSYVVRGVVGFLTLIVLNNFVFNFFKNIVEGFNNIDILGTGIGSIPQLILGPGLNILGVFVVFLLGSTVVFSLAMFLLVVGTFIFLVFRILALIFSSYLKLLILVIVAPFLLMFEAIPGRNVFSSWIKNIIGNLIVFPICISIFIIGYIIVNSSLPTGFNEVRLPYLYGLDSNSFKILIGLGLIILIPDFVKVTKEAFGIKDIPINFGLGTFFGGAAALGGGALGLTGQFGSMTLALGAFGPQGIFKDIGKKLPIIKRLHVDKNVAEEEK